MWYAIMAEDVPNSLNKRLSARPEHLIRLQELQQAGRLLIAGPFPALDSSDPGLAGYTGSLIVAEFPNIEKATEWAKNDPFVILNVYKNVTVKPFKKTFPN